MEVIGDCTTGGPLRSGQPKKVLIVDDSLVMRAWLKAVLSSDDRLQIVGEAADAVGARDFIRANTVDVVTLDIEMPGMSGLEFLIRLMRARPTPVVMLSSLTSDGSDAAIQALASGAIDCMVKPTTGHDQQLSRDICERVYQAACTRPSRLIASGLSTPRADAGRPPAMPQRLGACRRAALILLGSSTGGVAALETVLPDLDPHGPPVVIVQHMPGNFLKSFAERLNRQLPQRVMLAEDGLTLRRGDVVLAPGNGKHTEVERAAEGWQCRFAKNEPALVHSPSVDRLFHSAVSEAANVSAAILTGLGKDGADGLLQLAKAGAATFGQDEETSVVYGMPRAAFAIGAVNTQLPIDRIGPALRACFQAGGKRSRPDNRVKQL
jgi:two-component system chemotaxis response regulator CheB